MLNHLILNSLYVKRLPHITSASESQLLQRINEALALLDSTPEPDRGLIQSVLDTIISGQELDIQRFGAALESLCQALQTLEELDDYTFRVAGCVACSGLESAGHICSLNIPSTTHCFSSARSIRQRSSTGKYILRDIPRDLRQAAVICQKTCS
jgi:hypothetical protein